MSSEQQAGNGHQGHDHGPKGDNQSVSAAGHEAAGHEAAGHEAAGHEAAGEEAAGEEPNPHPEPPSRRGRTTPTTAMTIMAMTTRPTIRTRYCPQPRNPALNRPMTITNKTKQHSLPTTHTTTMRAMSITDTPTTTPPNCESQPAGP